MSWPRYLAVMGVLAVMVMARAQESEPKKDNDPDGTSIYESLRLKTDDNISLRGLLLNDPDRTPDYAAMSGENRDVVAKGNRYALIVGVHQASFRGIKQQPLPQCVFDAKAVSECLKASGYQCIMLTDGIDGVNIKGDAEPTVANVMTQLRDIAAQTRPGDQILFYGSSHGGIVDDKPSLIVRDGAVDLMDVKAELARSAALVRLCVLDCCRDDKSYTVYTVEPRDVHTIMACRPDEVSGAGDRGLSIFTEVFCEAMTDCRADRVKDGMLELDEVLHYLDREVPLRAKANDPAASQHPTRIVVDPKMLNPVLAVCNRQGAEAEPTALSGAVAPAARNDMILTTLLLGKICVGMTTNEVTQAMGHPPKGGLVLLPDGNTAGVWDDEPKEGVSTYVVFEKDTTKVLRTAVQFQGACQGEYDAAFTRTAIPKLIGAERAEKLALTISGWSAQRVFKELGCATFVLLASDGQGDGQIIYQNVPVPQEQLVVQLEDGKVNATMVTPMWVEYPDKKGAK